MSRFRWAVVMALVAALVVPPLGLGIQEKEGAKELFDKMEQKLTKARTVEFLIEWKVAAVTVDPSEAKVKLLFAPGNKLRMEMKLKSVGEEVELTLVSDGAKMKRVYRREKP